MNMDGSNRRQVVSIDFSFGSIPNLSPDGKQIGFASGSPNPGINIMDADGGNQRLLYPGSVYGPPSWSPDGTRILFEVSHGNNKQIAIMKADGSDMRLLTQSDPSNDRLSNEYEVWSPDGKQIAFVTLNGKDREESMQIKVMDPDGGNIRLLNPLGARPVWSPLCK